MVPQSDTEQELGKVFPQVVPEGVESIVVVREEYRGPEPGRGDLVMAALIFKSQGPASCDESNLIGACLRKRNLVVVVRDARAGTAREALDDLD
ncbi:MAG: hypothetical protein AABM30_09500 [Actinomycetota bacterium]